MNLHNIPGPRPTPATGRYDREWFANIPWETNCNLEVAGVIEKLLPNGTTACERIDNETDGTPDFWSIYFHTDDPEHPTEVLGDYPTYEAAMADAKAIVAEYCPHAFIENYV